MREQVLIECARNKGNKAKIDVIVEEHFIDRFGKPYIERKLFDTINPDDKPMIFAQIRNIYGITV